MNISVLKVMANFCVVYCNLEYQHIPDLTPTFYLVRFMLHDFENSNESILYVISSLFLYLFSIVYIIVCFGNKLD